MGPYSVILKLAHLALVNIVLAKEYMDFKQLLMLIEVKS